MCQHPINQYIYIYIVYVYLFVYTYAYFSAIPFGLYLLRGGPSVRRLWCQEQTIQAFNLPVQKPKSSTWSRAAAEFSNNGVGCTVAHGNTIRMSLVIYGLITTHPAVGSNSNKLHSNLSRCELTHWFS